MAKISLEKIRKNRETKTLCPRSYKFSPIVAEALDKRATRLGMSKVGFLEMIIVEYLNADQKTT